MQKILVSPSILSADFANLERDCNLIKNAGADYIHCDVMDGLFVPNISFGLPVVQSIAKVGLPLDVHLMIVHPQNYVKKFVEAGASIVTFHYESTEDVRGTMQLIKQCGAKVGVSIRPNTPVELLLPYKGMFDLLLVMSVEPGFGGQSFLPQILQKISTARQLFPDVIIEVDGGIGENNAKQVVQAGANMLVAGSAVFKSKDVAKTIANLKNSAN